MKKPILYLVLNLAILGHAYADVFFVSNSGSDNSDGLSIEAAFKTLATAAARVAPGDVILLRRGDIFRESVEIPARNIEVNAYGPADEPLPIISGAVRVTGFKPYRNGIYVAEIETMVGYLFVDNELMTIARYPNEGWLRTKHWEDTNLPKEATAEQLQQPNTMVECKDLIEYPNNEDNFWIGANIRWRHHSWWYETRKVVDYESSGKLFLSDRSFGSQHSRPELEKGWGFYLDNKLELLDEPGEWYFDKEKQRVYLYPADGKSPDELLVEGSARSLGLSISDGLVQHVRFQHQKDVGLKIDGVSVVQYCEFEGIGRDADVTDHYAGGAGLWADKNVRNARISHNTFLNNFNTAINWRQNPDDTTSSIIERNIIRNTAMVRGYGGSGSWHAIAILLATGRNVHVQYNHIEKSGYVGILLGTEGNFAEYNIIKNAMATLNDGGAIYTDCPRSTIRYNIILDTRGGMESSGSWGTLAHGIWPEFLNEYRENIIEFNTVVGSGGDGIFLANNFDCVIRNNVCYNNDRHQLLMVARGSRNINAQQNHLIANNVLYAAAPSQNTLYFDERNDYGVMRSNYFCKPSSEELIDEGASWPGMGPAQHFTLNEWQDQYKWADASARTDIRKNPGTNDNSEIFINDTEERKTFTLTGSWRNLDGERVNSSITLEPYTSQILIMNN